MQYIEFLLHQICRDINDFDTSLLSNCKDISCEEQIEIIIFELLNIMPKYYIPYPTEKDLYQRDKISSYLKKLTELRDQNDTKKN